MSGSKKSLPLLDQVSVANPCPAKWEDMQGNEQKRFCAQCQLHVYDLSSMTTEAAEQFLQSETSHRKRTCIRMVRRTDGRVLTRDCPVGIRRLRLSAIRAIAATLAFLCSGLAMATGGSRIAKWAEAQNEIHFLGALAPPAGYTPNSPPIQGEAIMGGICLPESDPSISTSLQPGLDATTF